MDRGLEVLVRGYGGNERRLRVWEDHGDSVSVCSDDEYERAVTQGDEPLYVGVARDAILEAYEATTTA
jgi:hypothetical protein